MESMIPALATPIIHAVSQALLKLAATRPEAWALVLAAVALPGALLRHRRAHPPA
jgi:hypothetical protein